MNIFEELRNIKNNQIKFPEEGLNFAYIATNPGDETIGFSQDTVDFAKKIDIAISKIGRYNLYNYGKNTFPKESLWTVEHCLIAFLTDKELNIKYPSNEYIKYLDALFFRFENAKTIIENIHIINSLGWAIGNTELKSYGDYDFDWYSFENENEAYEYVAKLESLIDKYQ